MTVATCFSYWSIVEGGLVLRVAMRNGHGDELFVLTPVDHGSGRSLRVARETAVGALLDALDQDHPPGRVRLETEEA